MRINQFVASASKLSRRNADAAIAAGRVMLNGQRATLGSKVSPEDHVQLDGVDLITPSHFDYVAYHKPKGLVVSRTVQAGNETIYQHLPTHLHALQAIGRLDKDSSGLLLLTNDGQFAHRAAHPSFGKRKVYEVTLGSAIKPSDLSRLEAGVELEDGMSHLKVSSHHDRELTIELEEGRNRQIRRTFEALGYRVSRLHRTKFGSLELGSLEAGAWRNFKPEERL